MFRYIRFIGFVLILPCLLTACSLLPDSIWPGAPATPSDNPSSDMTAGTSADVQTTAPPSPVSLFDEGLYVTLPGAGTNQWIVYDHMGSIVGTIRSEDMPQNIWKKDDMLICYDMNASGPSIFSFSTLSQVYTGDKNDLLSFPGEGLFLAANGQSGVIQLYQANGELLNSFQPAQSAPYYYYDFEPYGQNYLLYSFDDKGNFCIAPRILDSKGKVLQTVNITLNPGSYSPLKSFGDYFLRSSQSALDSYDICDIDGQVIMQNVVPMYDRLSLQTYFVYQWDGSKYQIYDDTLSLVGSSSANDVPQYSSGPFLDGFSYEQDGLSFNQVYWDYRSKQYYHYMISDGELIISTGSGIKRLAIQPGEMISDLSPHMVVLSPTNTAQSHWRLLSLETGEELTSGDNQSTYVVLGNNYAITYAYQQNTTTSTIIDSQGAVRYETEKSNISALYDNLVMLYRGNYCGVADLDGNWVLRAIGRFEE